MLKKMNCKIKLKLLIKKKDELQENIEVITSQKKY